jgi:hypothetical protein
MTIRIGGRVTRSPDAARTSSGCRRFFIRPRIRGRRYWPGVRIHGFSQSNAVRAGAALMRCKAGREAGADHRDLGTPPGEDSPRVKASERASFAGSRREAEVVERRGV